MKTLSGPFVLLLCLAALLAASAQQAPPSSTPIRPRVPEPPQDNEKDPTAGDEDVLKTLGHKLTCDDQATPIDALLVINRMKEQAREKRDLGEWDVSKIQAHLENQDAFSGLLGRIFSDENLKPRYAGSAMPSVPGEEATIWIKGKLGEEEKKRMETLIKNTEEIQNMGIKIVDGMRFSEEDQEARMDAIITHLEKTFQRTANINAAVRPGDLLLITLPATDAHPPSDHRETPCLGTGGDMVDSVLLKPQAVALLLPAVQAAREARRQTDGNGDDIFNFRDDPRGIMFEFLPPNNDGDIDDHARGGRQVSGGGFVCTSGFSVYRISDGLNGITTAGHCTGMNLFDAEFPEADFALFHRDEHCGSHGDLEWKTTNHIELAEYWASPTDRRNVRSVETWYSVNNWYCLYSRMTGTRTCDQVYSTSTSQSGCQNRKSHRLVAMDSRSGIGGDSGGPWSWGTKAVGTVKGAKTIWFKWRSTFTKASRFDNALGVWIKTK